MRAVTPTDGPRRKAGDERAVSEVMGVILLLAITVILASVIGFFVLNISDRSLQEVPNTQLEPEWDGDNLTLMHTAGTAIDADSTRLVGPGGETGFDDGNWSPGWSDEIGVGDESEIDVIGNGLGGPGDTLRVVWEEDGTSTTLKEISVPN